MVRASHTLCGIHRTGGLTLIALTAGALEQTLLALQRMPVPMPVDALPALTDAVGGLAVLLGRVRAREAFNATDFAIAAEIQQELEALRRAASIARGSKSRSPASPDEPQRNWKRQVPEMPPDVARAGGGSVLRHRHRAGSAGQHP
jgi:chemotaxis protein histidine kinase CheA